MRIIILIATMLLCINVAHSQVLIESEYIGSSKYKDKDGNKTNGKGSSMITTIGANIPLSVKIDENKKPIVWSMVFGGSYSSLNNKNISRDLAPSEIMNTQLGLIHLRPISKKWSLMANIGAGSFTAHAKFDEIRMTHIMLNGGAIFIWHIKDNLSLGGGLSINSSLGYPMAFPAIYFQWKLDGKYTVDVQMGHALEFSTGINFSDKFSLKLVGSAKGALGLERINDQKMMFIHQYMITGLRPEFRLGKFTIPITVGASVMRMAKYQERKLSTLFNNDDENDSSNFGVAPYGSIAVSYSF